MIQIISGTIGALGFCIEFGVRKSYMWLIALNAGISWWIYLLCSSWVDDFFGFMVSAAFCSMFAAVTARFINVPAVVLQMPATVPMIPGSGLYYTMYYAITAETELFKTYLLSTVKAIFAMAIGFAVIAVVLKKYGTQLTGLVNNFKQRLHAS